MEIIISFVHMIIILLAAFILGTFSLDNPGLLIQIPATLQLPPIPIPLPQPIQSILVDRLELTNVQLREVEYSWRLEHNKFIISIPSSLISFDWSYSGDHGLGTFSQTYLILDIYYELVVNGEGRMEVKVVSSALSSDEKRSKIKVDLGGNVKEVVAVVVTDIILNRAKFAFRQAITKALNNAAKSLSSPLDTDIQLICVQSKCINLNTTLLSKPLITSTDILIQVNAAAYIVGESSGVLNPKQALVKGNTSQLTLHVHEEVANKVSQLYFSLHQLDFNISASQISSVGDINSQTLAIVFPNMQYFQSTRDVIFGLHVETPTFRMLDDAIQLWVNGTAAVYTQRTSQSPEPYLSEVDGFAQVVVDIVTGDNRMGGKINDITARLDFKEEDLDAHRANAEGIEKYLGALQAWMASAFNGANKQYFTLQLFSWKIKPHTSIQNKHIQIYLTLP